MGADRGNVRDPEMPPAHPGRHYSLRSRIRHTACQRRMCGIRRPSGNGTSEYIYYTCPYKASNPRHAAACPGHPATSVSVREDTVVAAITAFLDQYVFGYDRAAMLKDRIPVTTAEHPAARAREHARLSADIARTDTAQAGCSPNWNNSVPTKALPPKPTANVSAPATAPTTTSAPPPRLSSTPSTPPPPP